MQKYVILDKKVGQTPLQCSDSYKASHPELEGVPTTYAGRLDPMASGKLLILIGEECKKKEQYLHLDKEYKFEVLFGVSSDTADVLGRLSPRSSSDLDISLQKVNAVIGRITGEIELPYPHFSSKTVQGKPLHTWALEGRIGEIDIPTKKSIIHQIKCINLRTQTRMEVHEYATKKIETIPKVDDSRKVIGNDFRRVDIRKDWQEFMQTGNPEDVFHIATFTCIASSGTYMRTLAGVIAKELGTFGLARDTYSPVAEGAQSATGEKVYGLAYSIHRSKIGRYKKLPILGGFWTTQY